MVLLEKYTYDQPGFQPLILTSKWQVAQLNYDTAQAPANLHKMDRHLQTDEAFVLLAGQGVLIVGEERDGLFSFQTTVMIPGEIYNVPRQVWHNIALAPGARVLIIEDRDTHVGDFEFLPLDPAAYEKLQQQLKEHLPTNG
ncbi:hypothetical protein SDD30_06015 [Moorella naiadis]|uniref:hypothetical protein n=1 Tax=Moorella naiadis (nom. illeg.) TaxID=3093670 RepID=UPI003D9CBB45